MALELRQFDRRRAQQCPVDGVEALECRTSGGAGRLDGVAALAGAQLCVQLRVSRLKKADERTVRQRRAHRLHFRELAALAKDAQERGGLPPRAVVDPRLVEDDAPGDRREDQQDQEHDLRGRARVGDELDDVGVRNQLAGPSFRLRRLRVQRKGVDRRVQLALRNRIGAPLGQRRFRRE